MVSVADVRASSGSIPISLAFDPLQETQLLYGEAVKILAEDGGWYKIEAFEQMEFTHENRWQGYPGWVRKDAVKVVRRILPPNLVVRVKTAWLYNKPRPEDKYKMIPLSMATKVLSTGDEKNGFWEIMTPAGKKAWVPKEHVRLVVKLPEEFARRLILEAGGQLLGDPYFWGGRSAHMEVLDRLPGSLKQVSAVDCSGLTNLAYRVADMEIPRDSHEQFMMAKPVKKEDLKPGDLIFSASKENPDKVTHVAIFVDSMTVLEAPQSGEAVRKIEFSKKYGPEAVLRFGTYFGKD